MRFIGKALVTTKIEGMRRILWRLWRESPYHKAQSRICLRQDNMTYNIMYLIQEKEEH